MIRRVTERLADVDGIVVSCRSDKMAAIERALAGMTVRFAEDPEPDGGPMVGVRTGLRALDADYAAVVAADTPLVDTTFLSYLLDRAVGHDGAVPQHDGWLQPMQAVYRTDAMVEACAATLARGDRRLRAALSNLEYAVVDGDEMRKHANPETFTNLNTREEFEAVAERLGESSRR
jgi:molybdopterin-guanine dinucleotide biosynthesis protein A